MNANEKTNEPMTKADKLRAKIEMLDWQKVVYCGNTRTLRTIDRKIANAKRALAALEAADPDDLTGQGRC